MKKCRITRRLLMLLLAVSMLLSMTAMAGAVGSGIPAAETAGSVDVAEAKASLAAVRREAGLVQGTLDLLDPDEEIRVIVETSFSPAVRSAGSIVYTAEAQAAELQALKRQETVISQVQAITGGEVINQSAYLVNTFTMDMTVAQMQEVAKLDNVTAVYPVTRFELKMNYAGQMTTVNRMWEELGYTGAGTVIAIIDTGVAVEHPDLTLSEGTAVKITKAGAEALISKLGYGQYYSDKVPFAYSYTGFYEMDNSWSTHGLHVSGIAAGNGRENGITGIAPDAQILGLQVFDASGSAYTDDIIRAVEDAVKLGADVMNLSLGSTAGFYGDMDFLQAALEKATADGVLCCVAAGNDGASASLLGINTNDLGVVDTGAVSSPSTAPGALSVASVNNTYYQANSVTVVDEDGASMTGTVFNFSQIYDTYHKENPDRIGWDLMDNVVLVDCGLGTWEEISPLLGQMIDYENEGIPVVALVQRGEISFEEKIDNCFIADAVVIYNNEESDSVPNNVSSEDAGNSYGMPYQIMVSGNFGAWLKERAESGKTVSFGDLFLTYVAASDGGELSEFSSWGPTPTLDIKPEISAPGGNIYSLSSDGGYETMSGTSMATPYVSGAAALVLGAVREAQAAGTLNLGGLSSNQYVKLALMNTADPILYEDETRPYSVRQQGAGMVDPAGAAETTVLATYNGLAGAALKEVGASTTFTIDLTNYGTNACTYTLASEAVYTEDTLADGTYTVRLADGASMTYSASQVTVPAGGRASIQATLTVGSLRQNHYVEGFVTLNGVDCETLSLPVLGFYGDWYGAEDIIDAPAYTGDSILTNAVGTPATGLAAGPYYAGMNTDGEIVAEYLSFSPDGDGEMDEIYPLLGMLRSAQTLRVEILDANQKTLRTILSTEYVPKVLGINAVSVPYLILSDTSYGWGVWDGTVYNSRTGRFDMCPEGQYYVKVTAGMPGSSQTQSVSMPVILDLTAPALSILSADYESGQITIRFSASDEVAVYGQYEVYINGNGDTYDLSNASYDGQSGVYTAVVDGQAYVPGQMNEIAVFVQDYASNSALEYFYTGKDETQAVTYSTLTNTTDSWYDSFRFTNKASKAELAGIVDGEWIYNYFWEIRGVVSAQTASLTVDGEDVHIQADRSFSILRPMVLGKNEYVVEARDTAGTVLLQETKLLYFSVSSDTSARFYPSCYPDTYDDWVQNSYFISSSWEDMGLEYCYGYGTYYEDVVPMVAEVDGLVKSIEITYFDPDVLLTQDVLWAYYEETDHIEGASYKHMTLTSDDFTEGEDGRLYAYFDFPMAAYEVDYEELDLPDDFECYTPKTNYGFITLTDVTGYQSHYILHTGNSGSSAIDKVMGWDDDMDILGSGKEDITSYLGFEWISPLDEMDYPFVFTPADLDEDGCVHITGKQAEIEAIYANGEKVNLEEESAEFAFDFKLNPGVNYMSVYQVQEGLYGSVTTYTWLLFYLPQPTSLTFDQKGIRDGAVLYSYEDTYHVSGYITSYFTGHNLDINGENLMLGGDVLSTAEGKSQRFPFATTIDLHTGENPVTVKMDNMAGEAIEVNFTIIKRDRPTVVIPTTPEITNPVQPPVTDAEANCPSKGFVDVNASLWYHEAIDFAVSEGLFNGTSATTFSPDLTMTRAMFVTVLGRLDGVKVTDYSSTSFTDVALGQYYAAYVEWASRNGIVNGLGGGLFGPDQTITREQAAAILYRYAEYAGLDISGVSAAVLDSFSDRSQISDWAVMPMAWAVQNKILQGSNGRLTPTATATRAQVAQILMKFSEMLKA